MRTFAGCGQVLVQFLGSGLSRWLPFQTLARVRPVEERLRRGQLGPWPDHAERLRLRLLAYALQAWDRNTGASTWTPCRTRSASPTRWSPPVT